MFEIAAHRGGNSWESIFEAIKKEYDYVELDVHLSHDGYVIVQYSPIVAINGQNKYIQELEYELLSNDDKKKLILLSDVLGYVKNKIGVVIDIKRGQKFYRNIGKKVAELVEKADMARTAWIISFDHQCLEEIKKSNSSIKIAPMYVARLYDENRYWQSISADGVEVCNDYLVHDTVEFAHTNNMKVLGWCAKSLDELKWLVDLGVDIITVEQEDYYINYLNTMERS